MKTIFAMTFACAVTLLGTAQAEPQPYETTDQLEAQVLITKRAIDQGLEQIASREVDSNFRATDYWSQKPNFQAKVDTALREFEKTVEQHVFGKLAEEVKNYNSVYKSKAFSDRQKTILLQDLWTRMNEQLKTANAHYSQAILKLYTFFPHHDLTEKVTSDFQRYFEFGRGSAEKKLKVQYVTNKGLTFNSHVTFDPQISEVERVREGRCSRNNRICVNIDGLAGSVTFTFTNGIKMTADAVHTGERTLLLKQRWVTDAKPVQEVNNYPDIQLKIYKQLLYPTFKGSCRSQICVGLRKADYLTFYTLIQTLNRNITAQLADGRELRISTGYNHPSPDRLDYYLNLSQLPESLPFDL